MVEQNEPSHESRAAKRVLWEIKQQYGGSTTRRSKVAPSFPKVSAPTPLPARKEARVRIVTKKKKHWGLRIFIFLIIIILTSGGVFGYKIISASNKITTANKSVLGQLKDLLFTSGQTLGGEKTDRINILLMAVGGEGHSGENLADTIMVASIRPSDHEVALLSIPRDLYVQVPGEQFYSKINAVHAYGEAKKKDGGPELLRKKVEEITGLPINYYGRVDFIAFKSLVDAVGGVNITIPNTFFDYWHKITFPAGTEKMNGERALAYGRARYVEGPEGGDFKRAARQQQLLLAIRDKVFSVNTALDFTRLDSILNSLSSNIRTDMQLWELKRLYETARQVKHDQVRSVVLSNSNNGVLVSGTEVLGGVPAYVLRTRTGDYSEIQNIAKNIFDSSVSHSLAPNPSSDTNNAPNQPTPFPDGALPAATSTPSASPSPTVTTTIEIRNGTNTTGLAKKTSDAITSKGYEVLAIGNAHNRSTAKTTVYAIKDKAVDEAKNVAQILDASTDSGLPADEAKTSADILIILGSDAK